MQKTFLIAITLFIILGVGFFALNAYIYNEKQGSDNTYEPYRATLTGEYLCLPHIDETGPRTDECAEGIKTDAGEYYALDFNLMSQSPVELLMGERFTASGVMTPKERLSSDHWQKYPIVGIFSITDSVIPEIEDSGPYACTADAKICPDGSAVGRTGPACEFAECPAIDATSTRVTTYLGGTMTGMNIEISPQEIVSDSRCPLDVTCIWAGTVEVRTIIASHVAHGEHILTLGTPQVFGDHTITMTGVTPVKTQDAIPVSSYHFTFEITKN